MRLCGLFELDVAKCMASAQRDDIAVFEDSSIDYRGVDRQAVLAAGVLDDHAVVL